MNTPRAQTHRGRPSPRPTWIDRDQSILAFNARVLHWAQRADVPVLERLRYLCIVSSNLDEFFEVRAMAHTPSLHSAPTEAGGSETFRALHSQAQDLVARQYRILNDALWPALKREGIAVVPHAERTAQQRAWVERYFERQVAPLLAPIALDPAHPFPRVANKSLHFIVELSDTDAYGRSYQVAIVRVPRQLPRLIRLPERVRTARAQFVSISSVIRAHLDRLFAGREVLGWAQFRVTRHADLTVDEEDVEDLRSALRANLVQRNYGQATRLEVSAGAAAFLVEFLQRQFELPTQATYSVPGPVNLARLIELADLREAAALRFAPFTPGRPSELQPGESIFARLQRGDVLIHQPYESYDGVLDFLRQAVADPQVLSLRMTIYRIGSDPLIVNLLRQAVARGQDVLVVVELKARFDEEANINWAEQLEAIGAQVVYGVVGFKTHAKMLLVTRREGQRLRRYGHLSTGNYNPRTARLYTDLSLLSADAALTADMHQLFIHLAGMCQLPRLKKMRAAPWGLQAHLIASIDACTRAARRGQPARVVAKMNALTDQPLMDALVRAARAGVHIDLVVRGACMLPSHIEGAPRPIGIRSIIGRFLEHSRVFYFCAGPRDALWLSSADWMNRNMRRRIEVAWPVQDAHIRQRIIDECLLASLHDGRDAWTLQADGHYQPVPLSAEGHSAQTALMQRHGQLAAAAQPPITT